MIAPNVDRLRGLIMFVIAWLTGLYVYEVVVQENAHQAYGLALAVLTVGLNLYARKRAVACAPASFALKFWLYLPAVLFLVVPVGVKFVGFLMKRADRSGWDQFVSLLPFLLKLGVPVVTLLWVYVALGWVRPGGKTDPETEPPVDGVTARDETAEN